MRKQGAKVFLAYKSKILLILRDNKPTIPFPNTWDLPGGGIEVGETPELTLQRELKEELNLNVSNFEYLGEQSWDDGSPDGGLIFHHFLRLSDNQFGDIKLGEEGQKFDFFSIEETNNLDLVRYLKDYLLKHAEQFQTLME